jgi:Nif-specific regulatory protein
VRELENAVEAALIRASGEHATQIEAAHLFSQPDRPQEMSGPLTFQEATRRFQAGFLAETLEAEGWNVVETPAGSISRARTCTT